MRDNVVVAEDTARKHGGNQFLISFDGSSNTTIYFVFSGDMFQNKQPKTNRRRDFMINVNWLTPAML